MTSYVNIGCELWITESSGIPFNERRRIPTYSYWDDKQENLPKQPVGRPPQKQTSAQVRSSTNKSWFIRNGPCLLARPTSSKLHSCFFPVGSGTFQHIPVPQRGKNHVTNIFVSNIRECGVFKQVHRSLTFVNHFPFSKSTKMSMEVFTKFPQNLHK